MVTTSNDVVANKEDYLRPEGSTYILPANSTGKWLNTSNNTVYNAGDEVTVTHGLHFIEIN